MKKLLWVLLLCYCAPLWAGLGDPIAYSLPRPPHSNVPPTPFDLPVPPRPTTAPTEHTDSEPFNARLDALWGPKKIRVQNDNTVSGLAALCHVQIVSSLCQANSLQILTDQDISIKSPLDRLNPSNYIAVSGFTDYFDLRMQGTTACKIDISCEYIAPAVQ